MGGSCRLIQGGCFVLSLSAGGIGVGAVQTEVCRRSAQVAFLSFLGCLNTALLQRAQGFI